MVIIETIYKNIFLCIEVLNSIGRLRTGGVENNKCVNNKGHKNEYCGYNLCRRGRDPVWRQD